MANLTLVIFIAAMFIFGLVVGTRLPSTRTVRVHYERVETTNKDAPIVACIPWDEFESLTKEQP